MRLLFLASSHQILRNNWTLLPMTDSVIARVHAFALHEDQPLLQHSGMVVEWRHDQTIDSFAYDKDYTPPATQQDVVFDADDYDAIKPNEIDDLLASGPPPNLHDVLVDGDAAVPQGAIVLDGNGNGNKAYNDDDDDDDDEEEGAAGAPPENHNGDDANDAHNDEHRDSNNDEDRAPLAVATDNDDDEESTTTPTMEPPPRRQPTMMYEHHQTERDTTCNPECGERCFSPSDGCPT